MTPLVIAETNFVVQLFTKRGEPAQAQAAEDLLSAAKAGTILLAIPCFSLMEAEFTLRQARKRRNALAKELEAEEKELRRSPHSANSANELAAFRRSVVRVEQKEGNDYFEALDTLINSGRPISLRPQTIQGALASSVESLELADAVVLQSVIEYLDGLDETIYPRCFLNYNKSDFDTDEVHRLLRGRRCDLYTDARAVIAAVRRA